MTDAVVAMGGSCSIAIMANSRTGSRYAHTADAEISVIGPIISGIDSVVCIARSAVVVSFFAQQAMGETRIADNGNWQRVSTLSAQHAQQRTGGGGDALLEKDDRITFLWAR